MKPTFLLSNIYSIDISLATNVELFDYVSDVYVFRIKNDNLDICDGLYVYDVNHSWGL